MKKATKGALAAVAGGTLLLGGAGTLAYWTDTSTVTGGNIAGGTLSLGTPTCAWTIAHQGGAPVAFDPLSGSLVPGDVATQSCTSTIVATGQNLVADLAVAGGTDADSNALEDAITPAASFLVDGGSVNAITSANDGDVLTSTLVLDFPFGTEDNDTNNGLSIAVTDYVITATQRDLTP